MAFSPGEIVQLKSGGPAMTVTAESADGVHCIWYGEASDELRTGVIPAACLEILILDEDDFEDGSDHPKPSDL
jgi:uncharacterized protein YodC (DUF2158 family)